jgi:hypothetical protein
MFDVGMKYVWNDLKLWKGIYMVVGAKFEKFMIFWIFEL